MPLAFMSFRNSFGRLCPRLIAISVFAQEFVVRQAQSVSDYAPGATEVLPRLAACGGRQ